jgi:hypothetical protein
MAPRARPSARNRLIESMSLKKKILENYYQKRNYHEWERGGG